MKKILRFTASWCSPCKVMAKNLEIANLDIPIEVVDIDLLSVIATEYNIKSIPTLVMLEHGREIKRLTGLQPVMEIQSWAK
jgi:thioredoxin 2